MWVTRGRFHSLGSAYPLLFGYGDNKHALQTLDAPIEACLAAPGSKHTVDISVASIARSCMNGFVQSPLRGLVIPRVNPDESKVCFTPAIQCTK